MWIGALNHDKLRCREQGAYNELLYKYNTKYYAASAALRKLSHINDNTPCTCLHVAYSYLIQVLLTISLGVVVVWGTKASVLSRIVAGSTDHGRRRSLGQANCLGNEATISQQSITEETYGCPVRKLAKQASELGLWAYSRTW